MSITKIYIKDWLEIKPYDTIHQEDHYYLHLSNKVMEALHKGDLFKEYEKLFTSKVRIKLCCFLTSYLEDLVSGSELWNSFVRKHTKLYDKPLPFYVTEDYAEEEINNEDICFLIWYFMNTIQEEQFIIPGNEVILEAGTLVMDIFEEAWEYAPENDKLKDFYAVEEGASNYYKSRLSIDKILFRSWLFSTDTKKTLEDSVETLLNESEINSTLHIILNENRDFILHTSYTRLLSLKGNEWAAEVNGKRLDLRHEFNNISLKILGNFFYKSQDEYDIFFEHIASGKLFKMTKKSYDHAKELVVVDKIFSLGLVKWLGEWWFSGTIYELPYNENFIKKERKSIDALRAVAFLDDDTEFMKETLIEHRKLFLEYSNGQEIVFMPFDHIEKFVKGYMNFFNKKLGKGDVPNEDSEDISWDWNEINNPSGDTGLVYFNPESGVEMAHGFNSAFAVDHNPYYDEERSTEHLMQMLIDKSISTGLCYYAIEQGKNKLPLFKILGSKGILTDIDFLLRFWKRDAYHTRPSFALVGKK